MTLTEKVAHLKGLMEGLKIDENTNEGKVLNYIADILEDMANSFSDLEEQNDTLSQYIEEVDRDLGALEDDLYDDEDDDCDCCDCEDCDECDDCDCDECDDEFDDEDDEDEDDLDKFYQVECPSCGEPVFLDDSIDPSRVICPSCHAEFTAKTVD